MRVIIAVIFLCILPHSAHAGEPRCGEVDKDAIEDTYEAAERVRYVLDRRDVLEDVCASMEDLEDWEDDLPSEQQDEVEDDVEHLVERVHNAIVELRRPLIVLRAWLRADVSGSIQRAKRKGYIISAEKDIHRITQRLKAETDNARAMMK